MASCCSTVFETKLSDFLESMEWASQESLRLYNMYFKTDAQTNVTGLSTGATAATVTTQITKDEYVNGITLLGEFNDFFANAAVTQADYNQTIQNVLYGSDAASSALSPAVEHIADYMKTLFTSMYDYYNEALTILDMYNDTKISTLVSALSNEDILFGTSLTKSLIVSYVTLIENYKKLINNEAVTQADYQSTVSKRPR